MKIGYISDLHIDFNKDFPVLDALIKEVQEQSIETLLIGGDISNQMALTKEFVKRVTDATGVPVHYVFGNHDYYSLDKGFHEDRKEQNTFPFVIGDYGFLGDTGWYDYRWYTPGFGKINKLMRGKHSYGGTTWPDHRFIKWPEDAEGDNTGRWFAKYSLNELKRQNAILDGMGVTKKIIMTHMVPHEDFVLKNWDYLETNVFFGSKNLSEFIDSIKPEITLFGHTHFTYDKIRNGSWCICSPLGYNMEWGTTDVYHEVKRKLVVLEV